MYYVMTHCLIMMYKHLLAVGYPTLRKIVRCQLNLHAVPWYEADIIFPHLPGNMSYDLMAILKFNPELCSRQCLGYHTVQLDYFLVFSHTNITKLDYSSYTPEV